ncbi:MAG: hypothetical protein U0074_02780 [Kouleothrix sp.]
MPVCCATPSIRRATVVGNSLRSDILPVLALGASAVYIPYHLTWAHEHDTPPQADHRLLPGARHGRASSIAGAPGCDRALAIHQGMVE